MNGVQGLIYATATLLPQGDESWSINLVGGANLAQRQPAGGAADRRAGVPWPPRRAPIRPAGIVLADTHYTVPNATNITASFSVIRTGTGTLNLVAGGNIDEASLYGIYTAGTQSPLGDGQDAAFRHPARHRPRRHHPGQEIRRL